MCTQTHASRRAPIAAGSLLWRAPRVVVALAGLSWLLATSTTALADRDAVTPIAMMEEESVLVATRDATPDEVSAAGTITNSEEPLEPISEIAERTPDLAAEPEPPAELESADDEEAGGFGAALADAAAAQPAEVKKITAPPPRPLVAFRPAKFNGIQAGTSTRRDLIAAWGEPAESVSAGDRAVLTYHAKPFRAIDVLLAPDDVVAAVKISLANYLAPEFLTKQLSLDKFEAVTVTNDEGIALGQAFPERGVLFMFATMADDAAGDTTPMVSHVVVGPLDAQAFLLRAERRLHGPYEKNIRDLDVALSIDPQLVEARLLLAEVYLATGQADLADETASRALELEPNNAALQLRKGQSLALLGKYDDAVPMIRAILDRNDISPLIQAQAFHEMARLAALSNAEIAATVVSFDTKAIEFADPLATSLNDGERRAAKRLLVEAHLHVACDIAGQSFNNKLESIGEWVGRASGLAEDFIANDGGSLELRLLVAERALAALAEAREGGDPAPWVAEAQEAADAVIADYDDSLWKNRIQWQLGIAYLHALKIEHSRRKTDAALRYGQLAIENLSQGAAPRQAVHATEHLVGDLYFHIGAVHAIHNQDHQQAAPWFDKALPLLTATRPVSELYSPRREGEQLVSMAVTYWDVGQQDRAEELTRSGITLIEKAVADGVAPESVLLVPYSNLAAICRQRGNPADATKYTQLANSIGATDAKPAAGRAANNNRAVAKTSSQRGTSTNRVAKNDTSSQPNTSRPPRRFSTARAGTATSSQMR